MVLSNNGINNEDIDRFLWRFVSDGDRQVCREFLFELPVNSLLSITLFDRLSDLSFVKQTVVRAPTRTGRNIV